MTAFPDHRQPGTLTVADVTARDLSTIRRYVNDAARSLGLDETRADRFTLAASEIVANAVEHGLPPRNVTIRLDRYRLVVEARDGGPGFVVPPPTRHRPAAGAGGGRGLWLARRWSDHLTITSTPAGTSVVLAADRPADD